MAVEEYEIVKLSSGYSVTVYANRVTGLSAGTITADDVIKIYHAQKRLS